MEIWSSILLLILGLAMVVTGADVLVDGASALARRFRISEFVIGIVIVGFGTSCPELVVSVTGALQGNADISIGNVVGSNIFNTLLILGLTAIIAPIAITGTNRRTDIPTGLAAGLIFTLIALTGYRIGTIEAVAMLLLFAIYIWWNLISGKDGSQAQEDAAQAGSSMGLARSIVLIAAGLFLLIKGGDLFVDKAQLIARALGVSDKFIAVTLLAGGTSLPELATCIVAAAKGRGQLALGNILGSNVFNLFLIIGVAGVISPLKTGGMDWFDWGALTLSSAMLMLFSLTGDREHLTRVEGALLFCTAAAYFTHLIIVS